MTEIFHNCNNEEQRESEDRVRLTAHGSEAQEQIRTYAPGISDILRT